MKYFRWALRLIVVVVIALSVWAVIKHYENKSLCPNCNVILVSLDTLSALHLPCYGYERNTAPNLCKFAKENVMFSNSYSQSPTTLDSHFSIFTSLYPHTHKMTEVLKTPLDEKYLTLSQIFRNNGYQTIYYGIINDDHLPLNRGIERGFSVIQKGTIDSWNDALSQLSKNNEEKKPTFLFLHTYAVHEPYLLGNRKFKYTKLTSYPNFPLTKEEYNSVSPDLFSYAENKLNDKLLISDENIKIAGQLKNTKDLNTKKILFNKLSNRVKFIIVNGYRLSRIDKNDKKFADFITALYDESISIMDEKLAKLIKYISSDAKLSQNTILIITADHGQEFLEHGEYYHAKNLYKTSTLVPLIMRVPGVKPKRLDDLIQGIDIYPTVLGLTGFMPESKIEGIDFTEVMKRFNSNMENQYLLSEFRGKIGIMDKNFRFYYDYKNKFPIDLYDLRNDVKEQSDVLSQNVEKVDNFIGIINSLFMKH